MKIKRIIRAIISAIPYAGSPLEHLFFGSQDDKEIKNIKENIANSDQALGIKKEANGNVINNPYDFGEI